MLVIFFATEIPALSLMPPPVPIAAALMPVDPGGLTDPTLPLNVGGTVMLLTSVGVAAVLALAAAVVPIAGMWKMFTKAGYPGWTVLVPFYNAIALCEVALRSSAWAALVIAPATINGYVWLFAPTSSDVAAVVALVLLSVACTVVYSMVIGTGLALAFDRSASFGVLCGLFPLVGCCVLGFGVARHAIAKQPRPDDQARRFAC